LSHRNIAFHSMPGKGGKCRRGLEEWGLGRGVTYGGDRGGKGIQGRDRAQIDVKKLLVEAEARSGGHMEMVASIRTRKRKKKQRQLQGKFEV